MEQLRDFFAMGGYGAFVWPAYGASALVLAKHDETYMPRKVADALKKSGQWQGAEESQ